MKMLSQEETLAIGRPRRTSINALHPKAEAVSIAANGKEDSFITTESIRETLRDEPTRFVRAATTGHV